MNGIPAKIVHPLGKKNRKKPPYDPDPYAKRTACRVAATPALQSNPAGPAGRTPQARACRRLEYPHLAEPSNAALKSFTKANCHVSPNPHLRRAPATDSRRPADPTSRMARAKWRILHVPPGRARRIDAKGIQRVYRCSSSRPQTGTKPDRHRGGVIPPEHDKSEMGLL